MVHDWIYFWHVKNRYTRKKTEIRNNQVYPVLHFMDKVFSWYYLASVYLLFSVLNAGDSRT